MTTRDQTRDKLVGSMRKTRGEADGDKDSTTTATSGNKSSPRTRNTGRAKRGGQTGTTSRPAPGAGDGYQSGGRVWPD